MGMPLSSKFLKESTGEKIVKIGKYLAKIWPKYDSLVFWAALYTVQWHILWNRRVLIWADRLLICFLLPNWCPWEWLTRGERAEARACVPNTCGLCHLWMSLYYSLLWHWLPTLSADIDGRNFSSRHCPIVGRREQTNRPSNTRDCVPPGVRRFDWKASKVNHQSIQCVPKSEPPKHFAIATAKLRSDSNKILHTQDDICYKHYYVVSYKSAFDFIEIYPQVMS